MSENPRNLEEDQRGPLVMDAASDANSGVRDFVLYGLGSASSQAIVILLIPVYTRWLGASEYGTLVLLTGLQAVLVVLASSGLGVGMLRSFYDYSDERDQRTVASTAAWAIVTLSVIVAGVSVLLTDELVRIIHIESITAHHVRLVALITLFEGLGVLPLSVFRAKRQALRFSLTTTAALAVRILAIVYFVAVLEGRVQGALYGMIVGASFATLIGYAQVIGTLGIGIDCSELRKMLRFGLPLVSAGLLAWVLSVSGRYFVAKYVGVYDAGIYTLADRFATVLLVLLIQPLDLVWLPVMLSVRDKSYARLFYARALKYYVMGATFLGLGLSVFGEEVLTAMTTQEFMPARHYVFPLCLAQVMFGASRLLNVGTDLARKSENRILAMATSTVVFVGLCVALTPRWGIAGTAWSLVVAYSILCWASFILADRLYPIQYEWVKIVFMLAAMCVVDVLTVAVEALSLSPLLAVPAKCLLLGGLPILWLLSGVISHQDCVEARRWSLAIMSTVERRVVSWVRERTMR